MKWKVKEDPLDRLMRLVSTDENGCWVHRSPDAAGYGRIGVDLKTVYAHRYAYERTIGQIPSGMVIDHLCRNRACCNPSHLEVVTQQMNCRRGDRAGTRVEACKNGHPYTAENTYTNPQGYRACRTCIKNRTRRAA